MLKNNLLQEALNVTLKRNKFANVYVKTTKDERAELRNDAGKLLDDIAQKIETIEKMHAELHTLAKERFSSILGGKIGMALYKRVVTVENQTKKLRNNIYTIIGHRLLIAIKKNKEE